MAKGKPETSPLLSLEKGGGFDLWHEHLRELRSWDDLSLVRWLNQTLNQLFEKCWRASHPMVVSYRLAATLASQRDLWNRRTFFSNTQYPATPCCGGPQIPFISFEVATHGLYCSCCGDVLVRVNQIPDQSAKSLFEWGRFYDPYHQVAHPPNEKQMKNQDLDDIVDKAALKAAPLLTVLGYQLAPQLLAHFPAIIWEDSDHCLDILPEDILPPTE